MRPYSQSPFANITPVVKNLLIINVIFFIATWVFQTQHILNLEKILAAYYPSSPAFRPWQIVTYMFMHGSLPHIFSNMLGLFFIGPIIEQTFGSKRFLQYYFITGIGALLLQYAVQALQLHNATGQIWIDVNTFQLQSQEQAQVIGEILFQPTVGASGAIFGIMIAIFLFYPDMEFILFPIPIPIKVKYFIPLYVLYELYAGISPSRGDSVAHFAHIGGALFGFILIKIWNIKKPNNFY